MSYHLYRTPALVLRHEPFGEGSARLDLLTRQFGLITATARSVREERSKLRYCLQVFSNSDVALVRGKTGWRITNATHGSNLFFALCAQETALGVFRRVAHLLRRLLPEEEKNEALFDAVSGGLEFLTGVKDRSAHHGAEVVLVLRILYLLGYLAPRTEFDVLLKDTAVWEDGLVRQAHLIRTIAIPEINQSLRESQL